MLRIVLPVITAPTTDIIAISASNACVAIEVVVVIDVDVVTTPAAAPTPTTTPERAHHHADAEGKRQPCRIVPSWRVVDGRIRIVWRAPDHYGIIGRDIYDLRIRLLDDDDFFLLDDSGFDGLLLG